MLTTCTCSAALGRDASLPLEVLPRQQLWKRFLCPVDSSSAVRQGRWLGPEWCLQKSDVCCVLGSWRFRVGWGKRLVVDLSQHVQCRHKVCVWDGKTVRWDVHAWEREVWCSMMWVQTYCKQNKIYWATTQQEGLAVGIETCAWR